MNKELFIKEVENLNIKVTNEQLSLLEKYFTFLTEYNSHTNLTAITVEEEVYLKHFYDSLTVVKAINLNEIASLIDIGTGAGFPGVVLKIFFPHLKVTLLDSNNKKTKFLSELIKLLGLSDINVINDRVEQYAKEHLNDFDLCISRAVAYIDIITELSLPLIKKDGKCILMKGDITNEEIILKNHSIDLGINTYNIVNFRIPVTLDERNLIILMKNKISTKAPNYAKILKRSKAWNNK